ncbi:MAG: hypothetical protein B5M53_03610 [Candidatus Cloacimonas sp. 4484_209]|nr:MAG: hypothetical protein B5M53_03610 [Candidatus Cloacimonas sp. 4484_209]
MREEEVEEGEETFELALEENDEEIRKFEEKRSATLLALIAPYIPAKVPPSKVVYAELRAPKEFAIKSFLQKVKDNNVKIKKLYLAYS